MGKSQHIILSEQMNLIPESQKLSTAIASIVESCIKFYNRTCLLKQKKRIAQTQMFVLGKDAGKVRMGEVKLDHTCTTTRPSLSKIRLIKLNLCANFYFRDK